MKKQPTTQKATATKLHDWKEKQARQRLLERAKQRQKERGW